MSPGKLRTLLASIFVGIVIYLVLLITDLDLYEAIHDFMHALERFEVDEIIVSSFVALLIYLITSLIVDRKSYQRNLKANKEYSTKILRQAHNIINNLLNVSSFIKAHLEEENIEEAKQLLTTNLEECKKNVQDLEDKINPAG